MSLDVMMLNHEKKIYGILDMIGDIGGVRDIFITLIAFFISPISSYGFTLKSM